MRPTTDGALFDPVLDPQQLVRIEAMHGGYGYQHLYGVACLLSMGATFTDLVIIEHDEDIELVRADTHIYIQVKTRNHPLRPSDVDAALQRFAVLRDEHAQGRRSGAAWFAVVSNVEPGPALRAWLVGEERPGDMVLQWPDYPDPEVNLQLPAASPDLVAALQACIAQATLVPFGSLAPETLVFKLSGHVQYLAAGHMGHAVTSKQVTEFFEQLVVQLQEFPEAPTNYRPHADEPDLDAPGRARLIVGVSGAGKTAWASRMALLHPSPVMYFDVGELPASALASSLAREVTARFLSELTAGASGAALPSASGLELLAAISQRLRGEGVDVIVVLDNVHRMSAGTLRRLVEAATDIRFVMIGQHWTGQAEVEGRLGIRAETLSGWSLDAVVAAFASAGCPVDAPQGSALSESLLVCRSMSRMLRSSSSTPMVATSTASWAPCGSGSILCPPRRK